MDGPTLVVDKTGYYSAVAISGVCTIDVPSKYVKIYEADTLFVPNVFTPNGDGSNEVFTVFTNQDIISIGIFDRNGNYLFEGNGAFGWDGGNASTGVYYWLIKYTGCRNESKSVNGWVQLVR